MKTKDANKSTLSWKKLALYVAGVAAFCFLNCLAINATDYDYASKTSSFGTLAPQAQQSRIQFEWMGINYELVSVLIRHRALRTYERAAYNEQHAIQSAAEIVRKANKKGSTGSKGNDNSAKPVEL